MNNFTDKVFTNSDQEVVAYDGSMVTWRISAYVLIIQEEKLLIIKNKAEKVYDIPGGGIELGETIAQAVAREAMEEAGAVVELGDFVCLVEDWFKHANGKFYQTLQLFYLGSLKGELLEPTAGTTELVTFVPMMQLSTYPLPVAVQKALATFQKIR